jgi:hypothetical protein
VPHDLSFAAGYPVGYWTVTLGLAPLKVNSARTSYQAGYERGWRDAAVRNAEPFDGSRRLWSLWDGCDTPSPAELVTHSIVLLLLANPRAELGNGLLLFFQVDNFQLVLPKARALVCRLEEEPT